ncbi:NmrA family NAD(P)-binding protein [Abyssibacter profundi]|uniref:NmrA family transcriptional regulator n=1 Tax=Abyssibacter profundi TaxID=2182787 RepID=A0A363UKD7_9GAMM|nr:NmrA family NAD(P)-binding protein [Abyssibacter profundi]PWN55883.1 NmrA family transcriptional regulator [Abyssibacter profundi]
MTDHRPVAVFGATGQVGRAVADALHAAGVPVRGLVRAAPPWRPSWPCHVVADWNAPSLEPALQGCRAAFSMVPLAPNAIELGRRQLAALVAAGVDHVVRLSVLQGVIDAGLRLGRLHGALDADFRGCGLSGTVLQPDSFMQNLLGAAPAIRAGTLQDATGQGAMGWIDAADIAAVAAHLLALPTPPGVRAIDLTGPELLTHGEVADRLSRWLGQPVVYEDLSPEALGVQLQGYGLPAFLVEIFCELAAWTRETRDTRQPSGAVEQVLGRPPRRLEAFLAAHPDAFPAAATQ